MICRGGFGDQAATGSNRRARRSIPRPRWRRSSWSRGWRWNSSAAEPLVASPCAIAWDERGRMYVAENRGYPIGGPGGTRVGSVALLEDTNADGLPDKRTDFATGLAFPNGVLPWRGGLIVTDAPDVLYLKDTDNDGKADVREVLLTGFSTSGSTQLRVNDPTLGPDGWVYLAGGLVGGNVHSPKHPDKVVDTARHDVQVPPRHRRDRARRRQGPVRPHLRRRRPPLRLLQPRAGAARAAARALPRPQPATSPRPASCTTAPSSCAT